MREDMHTDGGHRRLQNKNIIQKDLSHLIMGYCVGWACELKREKRSFEQIDRK